MASVSTITFNGSNAYELLINEFVTSWPHGAVGFTEISAGVQIRKTTVNAGVILRIRSLNAGGILLSEQDQTFTPTDLNMWERAEKTYSLPIGTDKVELRIIATGGTILIAQPKLANGASVGAYATNFAPQLTMLTPTGIYTGTLTTDQIIVGGSEKLSERLVSINASQISLIADLGNKGVRITQLEADAITLLDTVTGKTSKLTSDGLYTDLVSANQVKTGLLSSANNNSWINLDNGRFSFGNGALAWDGAQMQITGQLRSIGSNRTSQLSDGQFMMLNGTSEVFNMTNLAATKDVYLVMGHAADRVIFSRSDLAGEISQNYITLDRTPERILLHKNTTIYGKLTASGGVEVTGDLLMAGNTAKVGALNTDVIRDFNGKHRIELVSGGFYLRDQLGAVKVWSDSAKTFIQHMANAGTIGVDSGGPFYTTNAGTKKYLT